MDDLIKIAVDAMGGDGSPKKIIDGVIHNHKKNHENFFKIFDLSPKILKKLLLFDLWLRTIPSTIFFGEPSPPIASTAILIKFDIIRF